jgi:hypothetical protein
VSATTFQWDALMWLREQAGFATEVRPADRVEDPDSPMLVAGFLVRPSRAGAYAYAALWVLTFAVLLAMLGMPGMSESTEALVNRAGLVGLGAAAALLLAAWIVSRRSRDPALVLLHPSAAPATVESVTALHERARGVATWLVLERTPDAEVLAAASRAGVRCFTRAADGSFAPLGDQSASRNSTTTG